MIIKCSQIINPCGPRICHGIAQLSRTTSWTGCTTLQFFSHSTSALDVPDVSVRLSEAANHTVPLCFQNLWLNFHKKQLLQNMSRPQFKWWKPGPSSISFRMRSLSSFTEASAWQNKKNAFQCMQLFNQNEA